MTGRFLLFRLKQLYRGAGTVGIFRILFLGVLLYLLVEFFLLPNIARSPWLWLLPALVCLGLLLIHKNRRDHLFVRNCMNRPCLLFMAEYLLMVLPLVILWPVYRLWIQPLAVISFIILLSFYSPVYQRERATTVQIPFLPAGAFEWQSGFRKNIIPLMLSFLAGCFGFISIGFSIVSLVLLVILTTSFYSAHEPAMMVVSSKSGASGFLSGKLLRHAGFLTIVIFPVIAISMVHAGFRIYMLAGFLASVNLLVFSILFKYYHYRPGCISGAHQMVTLVACLVSVILPASLLVLVVNIFLFPGAVKNLKVFLHADY